MTIDRNMAYKDPDAPFSPDPFLCELCPYLPIDTRRALSRFYGIEKAARDVATAPAADVLPMTPPPLSTRDRTLGIIRIMMKRSGHSLPKEAELIMSMAGKKPDMSDLLKMAGGSDMLKNMMSAMSHMGK